MLDDREYSACIADPKSPDILDDDPGLVIATFIDTGTNEFTVYPSRVLQMLPLARETALLADLVLVVQSVHNPTPVE